MTQSLVQGIIDALSGSVGKEAIVFIRIFLAVP